MSKYRVFDLSPDKVTAMLEYLEAHPSSKSGDIRMHLGLESKSGYNGLYNALKYLYNDGILERSGVEGDYRYSLNPSSLVNSIIGKKYRKIDNSIQKGNMSHEALKRLGLDPKKYIKSRKSE